MVKSGHLRRPAWGASLQLRLKPCQQDEAEGKAAARLVLLAGRQLGIWGVPLLRKKTERMTAFHGVEGGGSEVKCLFFLLDLHPAS